jgi:hypothetical protein
MNSIKHIAIEEFKRCAAKGCSNPGIHEMQILFLGRKGWFCEQCKDSLMQDGLLIQQVTATANCDSSNQGVNNAGND